MTDINWMNMVTQTNWSWCIKCQGLFYSGQNNGPFLGVCPAGGQHSANPSAPYVVPFGDNLSFRTRRWLYKHYGRLGHTLFSWDEIRHDSYVFMSAAEDPGPSTYLLGRGLEASSALGGRWPPPSARGRNRPILPHPGGRPTAAFSPTTLSRSPG